MPLRLLKKEASHEEVFLERYSSMLTWARNLTKNDADLAEDLVQDAFIQFTLTSPGLDQIQNLDGYLYGLLRNLCLSHFRRVSKNRLEQLSIYEYDSAADGLETVDLRDQENARDNLQQICSFLSIRKNSARAAGVFILRFFHGYFPSEIAQVLRTSRPAVDVRLMTARKEIRAFLDDPQGVKFIGIDDSLKQIFQSLPVQAAVKQDEFLFQLRAVIFKFREGEHQSKEQLQEFYEKEQAFPIDVSRLSHLVSCPQCLDEVNLMLKLPRIDSRFPTDAIGRDKKKDKDSDDNDSSGTGGESGLTKLSQKVRRVFEHKPSELRILVNGVLQGSLKASSDLNELKLNLSNTEQVSFIEIFSEQQVRLLMLNVEELPPAGASNQIVSLNLSDDRKLNMQLSFVASGAELQLVYHDPTYNQVMAMLANPALLENETQPPFLKPVQVDKVAANSIWNRWLEIIRGLSVSPRWVAASLAILLIAALLFVNFPNQSVSASELLRRSDKAQMLVGKITHRKINIKATSLDPTKDFIFRNEEEWMNSADQLKLRRLYDENGSLNSITKFSAKSITTYSPKSTHQMTLTRSTPIALSQITDAWEHGLDAKEFQILIGDTSKAKVEELQDTYIIHYTENEGAMKATLVLEKGSLRAIKQHLEYQYNGRIYTFDFVETEFESFEPGAVDLSAFQIDADFIEAKSKVVE